MARPRRRRPTRQPRFGRDEPGIERRRQAAQPFLRSVLVVLVSPGFDDRLGVGQAREPVLVEALIAEPAVERFDIGVLIGFARFDQAQGDPAFMRPGQHGSAAELLGIIRAQHPREATDKRKAVECPGHRSSPEGASGDDGNRFGRGIIDNRQTLDHASIGRSVEHEVGGPHVVGCLRAHQGLSTGDRDLLPSSASDLQLGFGVQPLDAFAVICRTSVRRAGAATIFFVAPRG